MLNSSASLTSNLSCYLAPLASIAQELEFDREVYPIGVSLTEVSIIGALCCCRPWALAGPAAACNGPGLAMALGLQWPCDGV